jgi:hypothetical protein
VRQKSRGDAGEHEHYEGKPKRGSRAAAGPRNRLTTRRDGGGCPAKPNMGLVCAEGDQNGGETREELTTKLTAVTKRPKEGRGGGSMALS